MEFPKNYKLHERCKTEKSGTYRFKFQVVFDDGTVGYYETKYESYSKDRLVKEIKLLAQNYRNKHSGVVMDQFSMAAKVALSKEWLSNDEIADMIKD